MHVNRRDWLDTKSTHMHLRNCSIKKTKGKMFGLENLGTQLLSVTDIYVWDMHRSYETNKCLQGWVYAKYPLHQIAGVVINNLTRSWFLELARARKPSIPICSHKALVILNGASKSIVKGSVKFIWYTSYPILTSSGQRWKSLCKTWCPREVIKPVSMWRVILSNKSTKNGIKSGMVNTNIIWKTTQLLSQK